MLGVGLHSYGFTDAAFVALVGFAASQLVMIGIANLPLASWRSNRSRTDSTGTLPRGQAAPACSP
jgi:hypothetical protein